MRLTNGFLYYGNTALPFLQGIPRRPLARKTAVVLHRMWVDGTDFGAHNAAA